MFVKALQTWYDSKTHDPVASLDTFALAESALGPLGLSALSTVLACKITKVLGSLDEALERNVFGRKSWSRNLSNLSNSLNPVVNVIAQPARFYGSFTKRSPKLLASLVDAVLEVGSLQLLREQLALRLAVSSGFEAGPVRGCLQTLNK